LVADRHRQFATQRYQFHPEDLRAAMLDSLSTILSYVFLVSTMLVIGLTVAPGDIRKSVSERAILARVFLANFVLVPLLGYGLIVAVPLSDGAKLGLALLALAPGGLTAIQFTGKVKEALAFAAALAFLLTILSVVITPLLIEFLLPLQIGISMPYLRLALFVFFCLLLPVVAGFAIRGWSEKIAAVLAKLLLIVSNLSFVATIIVTLAAKRQAMAAIGTNGIAAMLAFILLSMLIGWWMGGPDRRYRRVMVVATSMRNAGLCLIMVASMFPQSGADVVVVAFMGLMVPPNMLFTVYHAIVEKRQSRKAASKA